MPEPAKEGTEQVIVTPDQLHDAAWQAVEAWQKEPDKEELKIAAKTAVDKAKTAYQQEVEGLKKQIPSKPKPVEKYEIKLPENSKLDAKHLESIVQYAKERGLSNEDAQAILDRDSKLRDSFEQTIKEAQLNELETISNDWAKQAKDDKEIGGESFNKNVEMSKRVIERYGTEEFKKALDDTGLGNHPELLRVFSRIGKAMSEDQLVIPGTHPSTKTKKRPEEILYGNTT